MTLRDHLQIITNELAEKVNELETSHSRFNALTDLDLQLASECDPRKLAEKVCYGARLLVGGRYAVLLANGHHESVAPIFATSGLAFPGSSGAAVPPLDEQGPLGRVFKERRTWRTSRGDFEPHLSVLPAAYPAANAYVAAPICSLTHIYGWLCIADKVGGKAFSAEDERILGILAAQVGRAYENGILTTDIQLHATQLLVEMDERERATAKLRQSEELFRQLAENIKDVFFITSPNYGDMIYVSPAFERIWGRELESPRFADLSEVIHVDDRQRIVRRIKGHVGRAVDDEFEYRIVLRSGATRWLMTRLFTICDDRGQPFRVVGVTSDITERKQAEAKIRQLNRVYRLFSGINASVVRAQNPQSLYVDACRLAVEQGDFRLAWVGSMSAGGAAIAPVASAGDELLIAHTLRSESTISLLTDDFLSLAIRARAPRVCNDLQADPQAALNHFHMIERGIRSTIALPLVVHDSVVSCLVLATDHLGSFDTAELQMLAELADNLSFALDRFEKVEALNHLAYFDALTGLPNRAHFTAQLSRRLAEGTQGEWRLAVVIADPMRFDTINGTFGRGPGDQLLQEIAGRLALSAGDVNTVARIAAGQFAMILPFKDELLESFRDRCQQWLGAPFSVGGNDLSITARAGIAIYPHDGMDAESLLKNADSALKWAKADDERSVLFTRQISDWIEERLSMETRLRHALERREFVLHYQSKVNADTHEIEGLEALLRWENPELGLMPPAKFIPLMEETGIIVDVGAWVLSQAILDRTRWLEEGLAAPRVAVNVSTVQLRRPDFVEIVRRAVQRSETLSSDGGAGIDIEVTESLLVDGVEINVEKLRAIRDFGIGIAIDDFGTGYACLGYLAKLPVSTIKIDKSFTMAMLDDPSAMTLVSTIITLAHSLILKVVAEGVETEEQAKFLRLLRCDQMQGYLFGKPLPFAEMTSLLRPR